MFVTVSKNTAQCVTRKPPAHILISFLLVVISGGVFHYSSSKPYFFGSVKELCLWSTYLSFGLFSLLSGLNILLVHIMNGHRCADMGEGGGEDDPVVERQHQRRRTNLIAPFMISVALLVEAALVCMLAAWTYVLSENTIYVMSHHDTLGESYFVGLLVGTLLAVVLTICDLVAMCMLCRDACGMARHSMQEAENCTACLSLLLLHLLYTLQLQHSFDRN